MSIRTIGSWIGVFKTTNHCAVGIVNLFIMLLGEVIQYMADAKRPRWLPLLTTKPRINFTLEALRDST